MSSDSIRFFFLGFFFFSIGINKDKKVMTVGSLLSYYSTYDVRLAVVKIQTYS